MRRKNYDYPDKKLEKVNGWARLRDEGDKVALSYKQLNDRSVNGMKEARQSSGKPPKSLAWIGKTRSWQRRSSLSS